MRMGLDLVVTLREGVDPAAVDRWASAYVANHPGAEIRPGSQPLQLLVFTPRWTARPLADQPQPLTPRTDTVTFESSRDRRERMHREHDSFDRMFRIVFVLAAVLAVLFTVGWLAVLAGGAAWLWSLVP